MSESIAEQIMAALNTELAAIVGDGGANYWYTPKVARVPHFRQPPDGYGDVVYMIRDTPSDDPDPESAFGESRRILGIYLQLCQRDDRGNKDPFQATTAYGTLQQRMIHDVIKKLDADNTRGGLAFDTIIGPIESELEIRTAWIVVEMLLEITYDYYF